MLHDVNVSISDPPLRICDPRVPQSSSELSRFVPLHAVCWDAVPAWRFAVSLLFASPLWCSRRVRSHRRITGGSSTRKNTVTVVTDEPNPVFARMDLPYKVRHRSCIALLLPLPLCPVVIFAVVVEVNAVWLSVYQARLIEGALAFHNVHTIFAEGLAYEERPIWSLSRCVRWTLCCRCVC